RAMELAFCSLARLSVVTHTWKLVHALLQDFVFRTCMGVQPVSRRSIPLPPRLDPVVRNDFRRNYFCEPRNNTLPESFKITDGITFFDEFEERPKFLLRKSL